VSDAVVMAELVNAFWKSDAGANCVAGLSLDRCLQKWLYGQGVRVDMSDPDWMKFYEPNGTWQQLRAAILEAWPKGRGVKQA
jgi:hypothetical protein